MTDNHVIVLFGARGDLAKRKLLPGMLHLAGAGLMPDDFRIIGSGRHAPDGDWVDEVREELGDEDGFDTFAGKLSFVTSDADDGEDLAEAVKAARKELGEDSRVLLYLSVPPSAMEGMVGMLGATGLNDRARVVMEKPFGHDVDSAKHLNATLHEHFDEDQVFRIDHFLGKEAAQDIIALRFANGLFEPIWNHDHIRAVLIDVPEDLGLEGRGSFYEETGALRDMVVTHLAQIMGLVAMERPAALDADGLRDAKKAAFDAIRPLDPADIVFGQFEGYRDEDDVEPDSTTETFVAARAWIDADRWRDVPFFLRTGKAMAAKGRTVSLVLREPEGELFQSDHRADEIAIVLDDDPVIGIDLRVKRPGPTLEVVRAPMRLDVEAVVPEHGLEAYERLLHDVMAGDQLLFARSDEIERLWEIVAPVLEDPPEPLPYAKGSWGPEAALKLAEPTGWRLPEDG